MIASFQSYLAHGAMPAGIEAGQGDKLRVVSSELPGGSLLVLPATNGQLSTTIYIKVQMNLISAFVLPLS